MDALREKRLGFFRVINLVWDALVVVAFVLVLISILSNRGISLFGVRGYIVMSGSMRPSLYEGAYLLTVAKPADSIKVGDIVTFHTGQGNTTVSHRVKKVLGSEAGFVTKGDASDEEDPNPVTADQVQGVAFFWINGLGAFMLFLLKPLPFAVLMLLMIATLVVPEVIKLRNNRRAVSSGPAGPVPPEGEPEA